MMKKCPLCDNTINTIGSSFGGSVTSCGMCGYYTSTYKVRKNIDLKNDLGRFRFICIDMPWGQVTLINKNNYILNLSIDSIDSDSFIDWLNNHKNDYKSARLSRVIDRKVVVVNLLDYL